MVSQKYENENVVPDKTAVENFTHTLTHTHPRLGRRVKSVVPKQEAPRQKTHEEEK